jgi:thymidylate kinase
MLKPFVITFSGIDGAGKTTQIDKLSSYLESSGIPVQKLTLWDNVALFRSARSGFSRAVLQSDTGVGMPGRPAERRDKNAQNGFLLVGRFLLYILDLISLRKIVRKAPRVMGGVIIFDRYIYDQLAALPIENWLVRAYVKMLLPFIPKPDIGYVLDAEPEIARARKPEYPLDFMHRYRGSFLRLGKLAGLKVISAGTPEDVHLAVLRQLTKYAPTPSAQPEIDTELVA